MMRLWYNNVVDTQRRLVEIDGDRVTIGRDEGSDLALSSPYVAPEALVLYRKDTGWEVVVLGSNGIRIGNRQLGAGEHCEIQSQTTIELFPFTITVDLPSQASLSQEAYRHHLDRQQSDLIAATHRELLDRMNLRQGIDPTSIRTTAICCHSNNTSKRSPTEIESCQSPKLNRGNRRCCPTLPVRRFAIRSWPPGPNLKRRMKHNCLPPRTIHGTEWSPPSPSVRGNSSRP